ncbi:uncharacterized protein [Procambarus clarkii]|uniref:uncharacterized protein n=1 Tax=Procambarus clarkii TaxID=6728 RepID=UPI0037436049
MKRNVLSGAQKRKRKRAAEEKENIGKLPKLSSWLNTGAMTATQTIPSDIASTSASTPAVSATSTLPSDITSTSASTPAVSATSTLPSDITSTSTSIPAMSATSTLPSDIASTSASTPAVSATSTLPSDIASTSASTPAVSATSTLPSDITSTSTSIPACNHHPVSADMPSLLVAAAGDILQEEIPKAVTLKEFVIQETDPELWNINDTNTIDYWIRSGPSSR